MSASKSIIAIVEDDASFRRALQRLLDASGFEAHTFASAEEFLGSAAPKSYACLILDIRLPGMSGFELFDHLTASAQPRPAIFITAQDEDSVRQRASRIPNSVYLRKASCRRRAARGRPFAAQPQQLRCGERRTMRLSAVHPISAGEYVCTS
jgi:CheY-like chemotaxis protein